MTGATLLVVSAFLHAAWNALLKRERAPEVAVAGVLAAALAVAVAVALWVPGPPWSSAAAGWAVAAGAFEGAYFITLAAALARARYGAVYAVARGGAMAIVWPASPLLGEPVTAHGVAGAVAVACGLVLVATAGRSAWPVRSALGWSVACAVAIAGYHVCYDRGLRAGASPAPLFVVALAVALPFVIASAYRSRSRRKRPAPSEGAPIDASSGAGDLLRWAAAGVLCTASFLLFLTGLSSAGAALALTLRNTSIVFAQGLALAMGERPGRRQLVGATVLAAGAAVAAAP